MTKKQIKEAEKKKKVFLKKLETTLNDKDFKLTETNAKNWATEWLEYADRDGNGLIDLQEFKDFVRKIEKVVKTSFKANPSYGKMVSKKKIEIKAYVIVDTFKRKDEDKSGELDVDEFGEAVWDILNLIQDELQSAA